MKICRMACSGEPHQLRAAAAAGASVCACACARVYYCLSLQFIVSPGGTFNQKTRYKNLQNKYVGK